MSDLLISYLNKVFNIFTRLKDRQWSNKERSLVLGEVAIIFLSAFAAYVIVASFEPPEKRVPIELITFENFLTLFPRCFGSLFKFFSKIGSFFVNLSTAFRRIFGTKWDYIIYIPLKVFEFLQFLLICIITLISNLLKLLSTFFSKIFSPFKLVLDFLSGFGNIIKTIFNFIFNLPGISHLIQLFKIVINDIIILLTSFFAIFSQLGKFLSSFNLPDFLLSLKNLRFFSFIGSFFNFIFNFIEWLFKATIGRLLNIFHLNDFIIPIFSGIINCIISLFNFLFDHFNLSKLFGKLADYIANFHFRFRGPEALQNFLRFIFNLLRWIALFPFFLILRFLSFFSYILRSLTLDRIINWWDNLCQGPECCNDSRLMNEKLLERIGSLEKQLYNMSQNLQTIANAAKKD